MLLGYEYQLIVLINFKKCVHLYINVCHELTSFRLVRWYWHV